MRSLLATLLAVTVFAQAGLAHAVEGATGAFDGVCAWSANPELEALGKLLDDANCLTPAAPAFDSRVEVVSRSTPVFRGPRDIGQAGLVHHESVVVLYADPFGERIAPLTFLVEQYQTLKESMAAYEAWTAGIGEKVGRFHADYMTVGPKWAKDADAALWAAIVQMNLSAPALGPNLVLLPEQLIAAPGQIADGAALVRQGIASGHYDLAAKGVAQVSGGVGTIASAGALIVGLAPKAAPPRSAITLFGKGGVPVVKTLPPGPFRFTQTTASPHFSKGSPFDGQTVFQVAESLRNGTLKPADVPVQVIHRDGTNLIVNTRSSVALRQAKIPESQWRIVDKTGDLAAETDLTRRLSDNKLSNQGTDTLRVTTHPAGRNASAYQ